MKKIKYILISALLVSTVALSGCGGKSESTAEQSSYTPTPTDTTVKTTGEKILINDSTLGEIWITELANVPKNTLDKNNFSADANFKYYNVKRHQQRVLMFPITTELSTGKKLRIRALTLL